MNPSMLGTSNSNNNISLSQHNMQQQHIGSGSPSIPQQFYSNAIVNSPNLITTTSHLSSLQQNPEPAIFSGFNPGSIGLDPGFRLTSFSELKGCGCKINQNNLSKILSGLKNSNLAQDNKSFIHQTTPKFGIGYDCSVIPLNRQPNLSLVQTTNFFYAVIDDPYTMGRIACANVLSDLYAMGVTECDNVLMILTVSTKMNDLEMEMVLPLMLKGFRDTALEAGCNVTGGQTIRNPWLSIGGTASSVIQSNQFIAPDNAVVGDVLVLTKPIGTHVAINSFIWKDVPEKWNRIKMVASEDDINKSYKRVAISMARINRLAAKLMHKYNAHGATDVSGYGLLGHAQSLASIQKHEVSFVIHNLPIFAKMTAVSKACGNIFGLFQGRSPETSGGLLIALPREQAAAFCKDIEKTEGHPSWIIGIVEKGNRTARIIEKPRVIEVPPKDRESQIF